MNGPTSIAYAYVVLLSALVAFVELAARYPERPTFVWRVPAAFVYVAVNCASAVAALAAVRASDWRFGIAPGSDIGFLQAAVAALGAIVVMRSSLFLSSGREDAEIGPRSLLKGLLAAVDMAVDRRRAAERAELVWDLMRDVPFERAARLPSYVTALLQNVSREDADELRFFISRLERDPDLDSQSKSLALGGELARIAGTDLFRAAVESLGPALREEAQG